MALDLLAAFLLGILLISSTPCLGSAKQEGELEPITSLNRSEFDRLVQDYEREFAAITGKQPQEDGTYSLDTQPEPPYEGYYLLGEAGEVLGFVIKGEVDGFHDVAEFYVPPIHRHKGVGRRMAHLIFSKFPGSWQVRQIEGADDAREFWRRCIESYTNGVYQEAHVDDAYWGPVTRQRFVSSH